LTVWAFRDCIAKSDFNGQRCSFYLARGYDFNIYLNPYFHEYDVTQFVFSHLSPNQVFLDVGAHGGLYTLLAGKRIGSEGKVLSFEPNPLNLIFLKLNIKLNALNNVTVIPKAVSNRPCKMALFYSMHRTALTSALIQEEKSVEAEATTIDDALRPFDLKFIKIIKVDTEGYDLNVLEGASSTLDKTHYVIVEQNTSEARQLLLNQDFQLSTLNPSGYLLATNKGLKD
jgi:FkbM family methyltransferase